MAEHMPSAINTTLAVFGCFVPLLAAVQALSMGWALAYLEQIQVGQHLLRSAEGFLGGRGAAIWQAVQ